MSRLSFKTPKKRHALAGFMVVGGLIGVAWLAGLFAFANRIPNTVAAPGQSTEAIVVLTGGSGRLSAGLQLLSEHQAGKLFVSGVYQGIDVRRLLEISKRSPEELTCCIGIGHAADTIGNALETAEWMREQGFSSMRLVTSNYHMPRSLLEFREALPDALIIPHPVFPKQVKWERWWAWPGTAALIVTEYNKFLLAWIRHRGKHVLDKLTGA